MTYRIDLWLLTPADDSGMARAARRGHAVYRQVAQFGHIQIV
jgi:hypothetical protein